MVEQYTLQMIPGRCWYDDQILRRVAGRRMAGKDSCMKLWIATAGQRTLG